MQLLGTLFDDLKSEISLGSYHRLANAEKLTSHHSTPSFKHNKFGYYSAWQRIEMLMSNINITNLLFSLASASYRKAGLLRLVSRAVSSEQTERQSGTASSHEVDDESCFSSDDSSRDDDSEPILGQLFKEQDDNQGSLLLFYSNIFLVILKIKDIMLEGCTYNYAFDLLLIDK